MQITSRDRPIKSIGFSDKRELISGKVNNRDKHSFCICSDSQ